MPRNRHDHAALDARILDHLRTAPDDTSVRAIGAAAGVPAGTAQQALLRLAQAGKIEQAGKTGRKTLWRETKAAAAA